MRRFIILMFSSFILASCSKVETTSNENTQTISNKIVSVSPIVEAILPLKPVVPNIKLNSKQKKYLNESLPPQVREVLEKAENFEVLAEDIGRDVGNEGTTFEPNRIAKISNENDKKKILEAFYHDASSEDSPASCFEPHHGIRATYQGKTVEIEICFGCAIFYVESSFGKFNGTIVRDNRKSEGVFNRIIESKSVGLKK